MIEGVAFAVALRLPACATLRAPFEEPARHAGSFLVPQSGAASTRGRSTSLLVFLPIVAAGAVYVGMHLADDLSTVREHSALPWILLVIALFIALGFEFVNGLNDTGGHPLLGVPPYLLRL
ncbi:hypothetical protein [Paraburkholderia sp. A1RI-2L]|uniref:hypothetical protein n=1 Tax=Paraburkholderia sp. A1RI-2L TaxID=3028367 RepID=UPI003BA36A46